MAMNKTEQARVEQLEDALARARALRWPGYHSPAPMTLADIQANLVDGGKKWGITQKVARGYFANAHAQRVTYGCSDGIHHNKNGDATDTQQMGRMYALEIDAWRAIRHELTIEYAKTLAKIDAEIERLS